MLSRLVLLFVFLLSGIGARAGSLKGVVLANEEGGPAVGGVPVSAQGANPTETGATGQFTLQFPDKQPGNKVQVIISKPGYAVVNWFQLNVTLPTNADAEPVTLLICKEGERERWATLFYRVKVQEPVEVTYQRKLRELEEKNQKSAATIARLQQERDQAKAEAEKAAEGFARLKPGDATDLYAQAMALFLKGEVDEALQVLDEKKLEQSLTEARQEKQEAEKAEEQAVQGYLLRAQLLSTTFKFIDAEKVYQSASQKAPDSFNLHFSFGNFSKDLNRFPQARAEYTRALQLAHRSGNQEDLALALNNLGNVDVKQNRLDEARQHAEEALKIYRQLMQQNPEIHLPQLALTLNNLGIVEQAQNRQEQANQHFEEALKIYRQLAQQNPEEHLPGLAGTLVNLGNVDQDQNRADQASQHYEEALKTYRELAQRSPNAYLAGIADTLNNLGFLDEEQHRNEASRQHLEEALKTYRQLAQQNPDAYLPNVATTLINLGNLAREEGRLDAGRQHLEEALNTFRLLAERDPETYLVDVAETLNDLALLDGDQNRPDEARLHYEEALKIYHQLAQQKQAADCLKCMVNTLNNFAILDNDQNRLDEARQHYEEALKIGLQLAQQSPETYLLSVAGIYSNLAVLDQAQNRIDEARQHFAEALKTYRQAAQHNPEEYLPHVASTLRKLGNLDRTEKHLDAAKQRYEEALKIYRPLAQQNPETYLRSVAATLVDLGEVNQAESRADEAQQCYEEALSIGRRLPQRNAQAGVAVLLLLGDLDIQQSRMAQAVQHYDQALQLSPGNAPALKSRGYAYFYQGRFADAEKDFTEVISKEPSDIYVALWLYLAHAHQGRDERTTLRKNSANFGLKEWPGQVVQFYLGVLRKEDVVAAAENSDPKKNNEQHCEAYFYLGEYALFKDDRSEAVDLFQKSIGTGVRGFVEFKGATSELASLKAPTRP